MSIVNPGPDDLEQIKRLVARLELTDVESDGAKGLVTTMGTAVGTDTIMSSGLANGQAFQVNIPTGTAAINPYNINLPVANLRGWEIPYKLGLERRHLDLVQECDCPA